MRARLMAITMGLSMNAMGMAQGSSRQVCARMLMSGGMSDGAKQGPLGGSICVQEMKIKSENAGSYAPLAGQIEMLNN